MPTPYRTRRPWQERRKALSERCSVASEASEHGPRIARHRLPQELSAGPDLAVETGRERVRLLTGLDARDHVRPAPHDAVAVGHEPVGELLRLAVRGALDAHLPRCVAGVGGLLLERLAGRLAVPAILGVEPVLGDDLARSQAELADLAVDGRPRAVELRLRPGVDEDRV